MNQDRPVTLAAIAGAHGLAGEVRLKLFTESLDSFRAFKSFNNGALTLKSVRDGPNGPIARFAEAGDRTAAEKLRSTALTVPRSDLPPLDDGEYYYSDLLGLPAISTDGTALGAIVSIDDFGAGDVLEIEQPNGKRFMVPMNANAVPEWDGQRIIIEARFVI